MNSYIVLVGQPNAAALAYRKISPDAAWSTCLQAGSTLLKNRWIASLIDARLEKIARETDVTVAEIVGGVKKIATFDVRKLYVRDVDPVTKKAFMRPRMPYELDDATAAAIEGMKPTRWGIEYKAASKSTAWDMLGRHKGMLKEPDRPPIIANIQINF